MRSTSARMLRSLGISLLLVVTVGCGLGTGGNQASQSAPPLQSPSPSAEPSPSQAPPASPSSPSEINPSGNVDINDIISQMTLEQKVGQMLLAGIEGKKIDSSMKKMIAEQHVGGIILYKNNFSDLAGSVRLVNELKQANNGNPAPLFISVDQEGGKVSRLPKEFEAIPNADKVGRTGDPELANEMGVLLSKELNLMGFNINFAPVLDINSNPKNPVIGSRSFGKDADLVSKMGIAVMKGLQEGGTIPVVKHFPGHGDTSVDSHLDLPIVNKSTKQLESLEWVPFRAAIENGTDAVMVAHILFPLIDPDAPASFSKIIIDEQLRGTLGFEGVVITDDMTMGAIADHYGIEEAAVKSVQAGSDILLIAHGYNTEKKVYDKLLQSVRSGQLSESRIDDSVRRILSLKRKYGLSDELVSTPAADELPNEEIRQWLSRLK
ncbi:beta-N-acetylhexosaminidase [Cohnella cholangitidis]|uniref:Beta-N-acetylhexosaminidase n=1 Tax=Cohnella cholangitidis TaxID=2598458 RepID=A0A7G5BTS0_9BACL|nr:beta-N-acetylhexosaminidase [Cohnella cholangitidis]QMV40354.1 beta-N-acetylhexosaminidase [Cohnella cholangitidis]